MKWIERITAGIMTGLALSVPLYAASGTEPYDTEPIAFTNKGVGMAGTLTMPLGEGPFTGVVLVAGAGPQDRNGLLPGDNSLQAIADGLTRDGIAVLRVDERGVGESEGDQNSATATDLATDIAAAVRILAKNPRIHEDRVGILAHSEGGRLAVFVASEHDVGDFLVLLAAPAVAGIDGLRSDPNRSGNPVARLQAAMAEALVSIPRSGDPGSAMMDSARRTLATMSEKELEMMQGRADSIVEQLMQALSRPQSRFALEYDPGMALAELEIPVLSLYGDRDRRIDVASQADAMRMALHGKGTVDVLPGINHFLQASPAGAAGAREEPGRSVSPVVLERASRWINEVVTMPAARQ